jgi:hypothetical protein
MGIQPALTAVDSFLNASKNKVTSTLSKDEQLQNMVKLIDACVQCRQIFNGVSGNYTNPYVEIMEETQLKLDQFGSELRTEIRRVGGADEKRKGCVHEEHYQYYPAVQSAL